MPDRGRRRYPRTARLNELLREVLASELERLADTDDRLLLATITHVEVAPDLRHATVLLSSPDPATVEALGEHRIRLQAAVGRQVRLKRTPQLCFVADAAIEMGRRVEAILRDLDTPRDARDVHDTGD